jgi:hypothetical protein
MDIRQDPFWLGLQSANTGLRQAPVSGTGLKNARHHIKLANRAAPGLAALAAISGLYWHSARVT